MITPGNGSASQCRAEAPQQQDMPSSKATSVDWNVRVVALSSFAGKVRSDISSFTVAHLMAPSVKGDRRLTPRLIKISILGATPLFIVLFTIFGPFLTDSVYVYSGVAVDVRSWIVPGRSAIDPNVGYTSFALGARAAHSILSGHLPLWNPYEGFGSPLLGEMQSAAMFPLTLLLAIPHGQAIEWALLQFVAGVGAFLFFKRFGLGTTAALGGSLVFELNGVFAWLKDSPCHPVAFLPWLFFTVESLRVAALEKLTWLERAPAICLGAVMASLALYAGFPEVFYLYSLLLLAWVGFRMVGLSGRQNVTFVSDLLLTSFIALLFSAPLLVSFVDFLSAAALGQHGPGFYGIWLNPSALIQYMMPYVFGPIFTSNNQAVVAIWERTGGYIGFVPIVFALAGIFLSYQRPVKIFLFGWVIIAVGVSHGLPGIYQAFMMLPLVKESGSFRYLNISWIFCIIFLSVLFIDSVASLPQIKLRRILGWAVAGGLILITMAGVRAWPTLSALWAGRHIEQAFIIGALLSVAVLSSLIIAIARWSTTMSMATLLAGVMVLEAAAWFLLPYLSYPRHGEIDNDAVSFLQANIGYQRVIDAGGAGWGAGLSPNYGSYFRIPLVNYDDLPAPKLTSQYIKANLDPYANPIIFRPDWGNSSSERQTDRQMIFRKRLSRYAQVGVKYVLARASFDKALQQGPVFDAKLVHRSRSMNIYQLSDTRDYFSAPSCVLKSLSRDRINTSCAHPSKLTRLELFMRGWSATVNGYPVPIGRSGGVFQIIDLPAGEAHVEFAFYPPGFKPALALAGATLLLVLATLARALGGIRMSPFGKLRAIKELAPEPSADSARDGMESTRATARRYLPNCVHLLAGIALAPDSEAPLHTKYLAAKEIVAPPHEGTAGDSGEAN